MLKKIKGQNLRAFISGNAVPLATSCNVTISGNMEEESTKDSQGSFAEEQMVSKLWNVQADLHPDMGNGLESFVGSISGYLRMAKEMSLVSVGFDHTDKDSGKNRTPKNAGFSRSGQALLTDFTLTANNRNNVAMSVTFTGSGALA